MKNLYISGSRGASEIVNIIFGLLEYYDAEDEFLIKLSDTE